MVPHLPESIATQMLYYYYCDPIVLYISLQTLQDMPPSPPCEAPLAQPQRFRLPWREAGPPNYLDDKVDSDQWVVNKYFALSASHKGIVF